MLLTSAWPCTTPRRVSEVSHAPIESRTNDSRRALPSGADLRDVQGSLTRSLCDQIFTSPIHWTKATNFPADATHAVDFGPGGASGIGGLTQRNLEGRGIRVLVVGEKGKAGAEAYSVGPLRYEARWSSKFHPKLVKTL